MRLMRTGLGPSGVVALVLVVLSAGQPVAAKEGGPQPFYPVEIDSLAAKIDSLEPENPFPEKPLKLNGYVLEAENGGKAPGAVISPACGGLWTPNGKFIRVFYRKMAHRLKRMGITTVLVDGFIPRGRKEICSQPAGTRGIDYPTRRRDSLAGLRYLRTRGDIDGSKIFLFTWGAAGSFETMSRGAEDVKEIGGGFTAAVMYYPQCYEVESPFSSYGPIQVYVGGKDTWNPPEDCLSLVEKLAPDSAAVNIKIFPDAYHGFDLRRAPKKHDNFAVGEVIIGGNPDARKEAYQRTVEFLSQFISR